MTYTALFTLVALFSFNQVHAHQKEGQAVDPACVEALESQPLLYEGLTVVIDTNVIMNDPYALLRFPGAHIVLSGTVLEELDDHKQDPKVGFAVREFSRQLRKYLLAHNSGGAIANIPLKGGSTLSVDLVKHRDILKETNLDANNKDSLIIATALAYQKDVGADKLMLVTNDNLAFAKAVAVGIKATEFNPGRDVAQLENGNQSAESNGELTKVNLDEQQMDTFKEKGVVLWPEAHGLLPNQFVRLQSASTRPHDGTVARYVYARAKPIFRGGAHEDDPEYILGLKPLKPDTLRVYVNGDQIQNVADNAEETGGWYYDGKANSVHFVGETFIPKVGAHIEVRAQIEEHRLERIKTFEQLGIKNLQSRSLEQTMALNVLLDDSIDMVFLEGRAGTSKTFSAVLAAMDMMKGERKKVLLTRAPVYLGNHDPGALPGGIDEKFGKWNEAVLDSIEAISNAGEDNGNGSGVPRKRVRHERDLPPNFHIEPFNFIRGRTFPRITLIVDEAQNMTEHEMKTVLTRHGEGAKFIVMGDVRQVDVPYMNSVNNGLAAAMARIGQSPRMTLERQSYFAVVRLRKGVRSPASEIISDVFEDSLPER